MKAPIKGENYPGIDWDHFRKVMKERGKVPAGVLNEMREQQVSINTSTDKPVDYGREKR